MGVKDRYQRIQSSVAKKPEALLLGNFALLIIIGFILLMLPISRVPGRVGVLDAAFTSVSSVCVTGLITVDTGTAYTVFGQLVILCLIQLGGLGLMTFAALIFRFTRTRLSYQSRTALEGVFFQERLASQFKNVFKQIFLITAVIESAGIVAMYIFMPSTETGMHRFFTSVFHTISAFCNAGFSLYSTSLRLLRENTVLILIFIILIILGGLGYSVLIEIVHRSAKKKFNVERVTWTLNTKVVLITTCILLVVGFLLLFILGLTGDEGTVGERAMGAVFQSVTARTAGFNTVDIGNLHNPSLVVLMLLMFIGGSPGSTAGGIKTTTIAVLMAHIITGIKKTDDVNVMERRIPYEVVRRAIVVIALAIFWNGLGVLILSITEDPGGTPLVELMFEQFSAFATVGLSTGVTPTLSALGKVWIILSMYIGRLGPLTVALWFVKTREIGIRYPEERLMIG